jgi:hypothetical protein
MRLAPNSLPGINAERIAMLTVSEIDDQIGRFLTQQQSLNDLNEWMARNTWNITQEQPDSQARAVARQIELALAEYSNDDLSLSDLRDRLSTLIAGSGLAANQDS